MTHTVAVNHSARFVAGGRRVQFESVPSCFLTVIQKNTIEAE